MKWLGHYWWFIRKSQSFMQGYNPISIFFKSLRMGVGFANDVREWEKMTPEERELRYATEDRTIYM